MGLLFVSRYAAVAAATRLIDGKRSPQGFIRRRILGSAVGVVMAALIVAAAWSLSAPGTRRGLLAAAALALALGGAHTLLAFFDLDRSVPGELIGMAALATGAPLIVAASGRPLDRRAIAAGLVALLYFATSLAYVRAIRGLWKGNRAPSWRCVAAHAAVAGALGTLAAADFISSSLPAAFAPVYVRTAWGLLRPPANLRVLGWRELGVAALFTLIGAAALALSS